LRKIQAAVDWNFVRSAVAGCYGHNGNVSVDPVVILKMMFLLFYDDVKSERELMRIIPERLDYLWFLGYGLDEVIPDHSVLSKARTRWGGQVFEKLFLHTVGQACAAGLVDGAKLHLDSSLVEANADPQKTRSGPPELIAALKAAYAVQEQKLDEHPRRAHYQKKNRQLIHPTDPDAPTMSRGPGNKYSQARPRYKEHRAIDDRCGVITAVQTTGADREDGDLLEELIDQHEESTGQAAQTAVTDSHYGTLQNYRKLQERGLTTHMAPRRPPGPAVDSGKFPAAHFTYHPSTDTYTCPAGAALQRRNFDRFRQAWLYKTKAGICRHCPLRERCTPSASGRIIMRYENQEQIDQGLAQAQSPAARHDRRRRQHLVEGSFAQAANQHHLRRSRWRRLWRQRIQSWLIAAVQNIKKLIGHRCGPSPAAVALATNCLRLSGSSPQRSDSPAPPFLERMLFAISGCPTF